MRVLACGLPASGAGAQWIGSALRREATQEFLFEREHAPGVRLQRILTATEQGVVAGLVQVRHLAAEVIVVEIGRRDPVFARCHHDPFECVCAYILTAPAVRR
jgi:hypothetical protein